MTKRLQIAALGVKTNDSKRENNLSLIHILPQDIPCGTYVHTFVYHKDENAPKAFLNFEGVDSCFYVWINGSYVGYSQVSHMTSEFDITDLLRDGENSIAVLVMKWCRCV